MSNRFDQLVAGLRSELKTALKARDQVAAAALRSVLAALDNAGAQPAGEAVSVTTASSSHVAGTVAGLGAAEVARRELSDAEVDAILAREITDRRSQADTLAAAGREVEAQQARDQVALLSRWVD